MMMVNKRISVCICISVLLSAVVTIIIGTKICAGGVTVSFSLTTPVPTDYQLFWSNDSHGFHEKDSIHVKGKDSAQPEILTFFVKNEKVQQVRLDLGNRIVKAPYVIQDLQINGKSIVLHGESQLQTHDVKLAEEESGCKVWITGRDPYLVFSGSDVSASPQRTYDVLLLAAVFIMGLMVSYGLLHWLTTFYAGAGFVHQLQVSFLILLTVCLFYPVAGLRPAGNIDRSENRNPNPRPPIKVDGKWNASFSRQFENWYNDIFGGRKQLIRVHGKVEALLHPGEIENNQAFLGQDHWLFYKGDNSIGLYQNRFLFTQDDARKAEANYQSQKEWLSRNGADFYVMVAPNKADVYGEFYKKGVMKVSQKDRVHLLAEQVSFPIVYPLEQLLEEKKHGLTYYKNDTHWSDLGAYQGYLALMKAVTEEHPDVPVLQPENMWYKEMQHAGGDLSQMLSLNDKGWYTEVYRKPMPKNGFHYEVVEEKKRPSGQEYFIRTKNAGKPYKVVVFRDSFSTALLPYLSETFGEVVYIWDHHLNLYSSLVRDEKPQIVIHEMVSRLADSLLKETPDWRGE